MVQGQHGSRVPAWSQVAALPRAPIPPLTVAVAMDITEDSDCGRTVGPDVSPGGSTCHPNLYDPDGHMASGVSPDYRPLHGPLWQQELPVSTQSLATAKPGIQT